MSIAPAQRQELVKAYQRHDSDSGSPEIQIAIITERIKALSGHLQSHKHDYASQRGLVLMVGKRNRLLKYLASTRRDAYQALIKRLGLRK